LIQLWNTTKSNTAKEDLLVNLRLSLISRISEFLKVPKVVFGYNGTRSAIDMFSSIAKGRGFALPQELSYIQEQRFLFTNSNSNIPTPTPTPPPEIEKQTNKEKEKGTEIEKEKQTKPAKFVSNNQPLWLSPMREFISKEVALYCHYSKLEPVWKLSLDSNKEPKFSINRLTERK